jgi:hypothetical protein
MHKKYSHFEWILMHYKWALGIVPVRLGVSTSPRVCGNGESPSTMLTIFTSACNVYAVHTAWLLNLLRQMMRFWDLSKLNWAGRMACYAQMKVFGSLPNRAVDNATRMAPSRLSSELLRDQRSSVAHFLQLMCCVIVAVVSVFQQLECKLCTGHVDHGHSSRAGSVLRESILVRLSPETGVRERQLATISHRA